MLMSDRKYINTVYFKVNKYFEKIYTRKSLYLYIKRNAAQILA